MEMHRTILAQSATTWSLPSYGAVPLPPPSWWSAPAAATLLTVSAYRGQDGRAIRHRRALVIVHATVPPEAQGIAHRLERRYLASTPAQWHDHMGVEVARATVNRVAVAPGGAVVATASLRVRAWSAALPDGTPLDGVVIW